MAIALVGSQSIANTSGTQASFNLVLPANPTAGNFIPVEVSANAGSTSGVASTNDTYTLAKREENTGSQGYAEVWSAANIVGGAGSKTIAVTNTKAFGGWANEFSGVATSSPLDIAGGSATTLTPGSQTPNFANELWIAVATTNNGSSSNLAAPAGYTDGGVSSAGAFTFSGDAAYLIESGSGAQNPTFGGTASSPCSVLVSFKPSSGTAITASLTASAAVTATNTEAVTLTLA